jgi:hypothetical protein
MTENIGAGNYGNVITGNTITSYAVLNGDANIQTGDQITGRVPRWPLLRTTCLV